MASGTLLSRVFGLLRDVLLAAYFDRSVSDAWLVALRIPNLFRRVLGEGALSASLVPALTAAKGEPERGRARDGLFLIWLVAMVVILGSSYWWLPPVLDWFTSGQGYAQIPGKRELTLTLANTMVYFLFFISLFAFLMALLNSRGVFGPPGVAPVFFNLSIIAFVFMPSWTSTPGYNLALGVVVGGALQALFLVYFVWRAKDLPKARWTGWSPEIQQALHNFGPALAGLGVSQAIGILNVHFASRLEEGAHTSIYLADRVLELPLSLVAVSIGTAVLPLFSRKVSAGDTGGLHREVLNALSGCLVLIAPAALVLVFRSSLLVDLLFSYGKFSALDAQKTTSVLGVYSLSLLSLAILRVFTPVFYAAKLPGYTMGSALLALGSHVAMALPMMKGLGLVGLILSTSLSSVVQLGFLVCVYGLRVHPIRFGDLKRFTRLVLVCCLYAVWLFVSSKIEFLPLKIGKIGIVIQIFSDGFVFLILVRAFQVPEFEALIRRLRSRIQRARAGSRVD